MYIAYQIILWKVINSHSILFYFNFHSIFSFYFFSDVCTFLFQDTVIQILNIMGNISAWVQWLRKFMRIGSWMGPLTPRKSSVWCRTPRMYTKKTRYGYSAYARKRSPGCPTEPRGCIDTRCKPDGYVPGYCYYFDTLEVARGYQIIWWLRPSLVFLDAELLSKVGEDIFETIDMANHLPSRLYIGFGWTFFYIKNRRKVRRSLMVHPERVVCKGLNFKEVLLKSIQILLAYGLLSNKYLPNFYT